jgi:hypothetical protein
MPAIHEITAITCSALIHSYIATFHLPVAAHTAIGDRNPKSAIDPASRHIRSQGLFQTKKILN